VLAANGVGALAGSVLATGWRPERPLLVVALTNFLFGLPLAFLAAAAPAPLLAISAFLSGVSLMLGMSLWQATLQRHIPAESLSRVSAYDWFGSYAFYPLGLALWGGVAGAIGIHTALWIAFAAFTSAGLVLLMVRDVRTLPAAPANAPVA
jgi:hypothetical protein